MKSLQLVKYDILSFLKLFNIYRAYMYLGYHHSNDCTISKK